MCLNRLLSRIKFVKVNSTFDGDEKINELIIFKRDNVSHINKNKMSNEI